MVKKIVVLMSAVLIAFVAFACGNGSKEQGWSVASFDVAESLVAESGEEFDIPAAEMTGSDGVVYTPQITVRRGDATVEVTGMKFRIDGTEDYVIVYTVTGKDGKEYTKTTVVKVYPPYSVNLSEINVAVCEGNDALLTADKSVISGYDGTLTNFKNEITGIKDASDEIVEHIDWTKSGIYTVSYVVSADEVLEKTAERGVRIYDDYLNVINFEIGHLAGGYAVVSAGHEDVATNATVAVAKDGYLSDYALRYTSGNAGYSSVLKITDEKFIKNLRTFDFVRLKLFASLDSTDMPVKAYDGSGKQLAVIAKANEWQTVTIKTKDVFDAIYETENREPKDVDTVYLYFACVDASSLNYYLLIDDIEFGYGSEEVYTEQTKDVAFYAADNAVIKVYDGENEVPDAIGDDLLFTGRTSGTYKITYEVTDVHGRKITFERTITVKKPPYEKTVVSLGIKKGSTVDLTITDDEYTDFNAEIVSITDGSGQTVDSIDTTVKGEYTVKYRVSAAEISETEITRFVIVYEKNFGEISFDEGVVPDGFAIVENDSSDNVSSKAKLTIEKDTGFGYNLRYTSGNTDGSSVMRIKNEEFLGYVALFDTLTIRFVTNNPYDGRININRYDYLDPALYSYDETPVGTEIQAVIDCAKLREIYGANPTELRLYFSAVDASSTSMYVSIKDIKFAKTSSEAESAVAIQGDSALDDRLSAFDYKITVRKNGVDVTDALDANSKYAMAEIGDYTVVYTVGDPFTEERVAITKNLKYTKIAFSLGFGDGIPEGVYCSRDNNVPIEGALKIEEDAVFGKTLVRSAGGGTLSLNNADFLAAITDGRSVRFRITTNVSGELHFYDPSIGFVGDTIALTAGEWRTLVFTAEQLKTIYNVGEGNGLSMLKFYYTGTDSSNANNNFRIAAVDVF